MEILVGVFNGLSDECNLNKGPIEIAFNLYERDL